MNIVCTYFLITKIHVKFIVPSTYNPKIDSEYNNNNIPTSYQKKY